jgi:hypothetical protein
VEEKNDCMEEARRKVHRKRRRRKCRERKLGERCTERKAKTK